MGSFFTGILVRKIDEREWFLSDSSSTQRATAFRNLSVLRQARILVSGGVCPALKFSIKMATLLSSSLTRA